LTECGLKLAINIVAISMRLIVAMSIVISVAMEVLRALTE
jgi:hypothetical protein